MSDDKNVTGLVEETVDKGATTAEEIHRAVADLPLTVLERVGLFEDTASQVRRIQDASIGAVYDVVRQVNHQVAKFAGELLEELQPDDTN
jgi:polyhydroxyalkanoate synthesis regulator phasin